MLVLKTNIQSISQIIKPIILCQTNHLLQTFQVVAKFGLTKNQTNIVDGKIYLVEYGGVKRYRRLFMLPESSEIALNSDNPLFQ